MHRRVTPLATPIAQACSYPYLRLCFCLVLPKSLVLHKQDSKAEVKGQYGNLTSQRVHRAFYYYTTVRTAYSRTDAFTLSGFTTACKAALDERNSTGHRVAYIIMTGLMHSQRRRRRNYSRSSEDPPEHWSTDGSISAVGAITWALRRTHQTRSLHSLTKHLKSLLIV